MPAAGKAYANKQQSCKSNSYFHPQYSQAVNIGKISLLTDAQSYQIQAIGTHLIKQCFVLTANSILT